MIVATIASFLLIAGPVALNHHLPPPDEKAASEGSGSLQKQYADAARRIIAAAREHNDAWSKMEGLCYGVGNRLSGSKSLERAVEWGVQTLKADGLDNVRAEPVMVPHWVRGRELLTMTAPREYAMPMLGLGGSIATPPEGLTAQVLCVADKEELEKRADEAAGKIVLFNCRMPAYTEEHGSGYGETVTYRTNGAVWAAEHGAIASLVRSVTARSLRSPHTGAMRYEDGVRKIPSAAISTEDADMIASLTARGIGVTVTLKMAAKTLDDAPSANVIGELRGTELPDEYVVVGGHLDSWDVGQGAHDDGGGAVMSMEALNILKKLNLRPRRTIRVVLFTNEENGLAGGRAYAEAHGADNHVAAIETDSGTFHPKGFSVQLDDDARRDHAVQQMEDIAHLLGPIGPMKMTSGGSGADISPLRKNGFAMMGFDVEGSRYFDYHHSQADTLDKIDPADLTDCAATLAVVTYVLADMPGRLGDAPKHMHSTK